MEAEVVLSSDESGRGAASDSGLARLFVHKKRRDWGLAILAWEGLERRRYQFQDGQARTFKAGFYGLMEEVDEPLDVTAGVVAELEGKLDLTQARSEVVERARADGRHLVTFDDQQRIFEHLFPGGFGDPEFVVEHRNGGDGPRRKSHFDPVILEAQERFSKARLADLISAGDVDRVVADLLDVLSSTSLASGARYLGPLTALPPARHHAVATALNGLLWGSGSVSERFDAWTKALTSGEQVPSWELATAVPALVQPEQHVCVKPSAFRAQARWLAPKLKVDTTPDGTTYDRLRAMSLQALERLRAGGQEPRDLLDLQTFIWTTLRPKAREVLAALRAH